MATTKATTLAHTIASTTSSTADLNYAKTLNDTGVTSTEFDKLDGLTATTDELNLVDGSVSGPLSHRNLIINGAMQVAQRGELTASITSSTFGCVDRFELISTNAGTVTMSQEDDGPSGFSKSVKVLVTGANGDANNTSNSAGQLRIRQNIEAQNLQHLAYGTSDAKALTFSFYAKTNLAGTYTIRFYAEDGSRDMSTSFTVSSADASAENWKRYSVSIPADTSGTINNDNGIGFDISIHLAMGSNYTSGSLQSAWGSLVSANRAVGNVNLVQYANKYFQLTGVQLELGSVATPFEMRSYAEELVRCMRYFTAMPYNDTDNAGALRLYGDSTFVYPVPMRVDPTGNVYGLGGINGTAGKYDKDGVGNTSASIVTRLSGFGIDNDGGNGICAVTLDAEL